MTLWIPYATKVKTQWVERAKTDKNWAEWLKHVEKQLAAKPSSLAYSIVWIFYHELWHNLGYRHKQMNNAAFKRLAE